MGRLNASQLKERVTLHTSSGTTPDGRGGFTPAGPDTTQEVYARVRPLRQAEKVALGQELNSEVYEITIRRLAGTSAKQRVRWNGKTLNVQAVAPDEWGEYLLLTCIEGGQ